MRALYTSQPSDVSRVEEGIDLSVSVVKFAESLFLRNCFFMPGEVAIRGKPFLLFHHELAFIVWKVVRIMGVKRLGLRHLEFNFSFIIRQFRA